MVPVRDWPRTGTIAFAFSRQSPCRCMVKETGTESHWQAAFMSTPLRYSVPVESDFRLYRSRGRLWWLALGVLCTLFLAADLFGVESGGLKHLDRSLDLSLHSTFGRSADSFFVDVSN